MAQPLDPLENRTLVGRPHRIRRWFGVCVMWVAMACGGWGTAAHGQRLPFPVDAPEYTGSTASLVNQYVDKQVEALASGDPVAVAAGRGGLMAASEGVASPAFVSFYSRAVATKVGPVFGRGSDQQRLNIAIAAERLAVWGRALELLPLVIDAADDPSPAVASWGLRGLAPLLPLAYDGPAAQATSAAVLAALGRHIDSSEVINDVFYALTNQMIDGGAQFPQPLRARVAPRVVATIHEALGLRSQTFAKPGFPAAIWADIPACRVLTLEWSTGPAALRATTLTRFREMLSGLILHASAGQLTRPQTEQLHALIARIGSDCQVAGRRMAIRSLEDAGAAVSRISVITAPAEVQNLVNRLTAELDKAIPLVK